TRTMNASPCVLNCLRGLRGGTPNGQIREATHEADRDRAELYDWCPQLQQSKDHSGDFQGSQDISDPHASTAKAPASLPLSCRRQSPKSSWVSPELLLRFRDALGPCPSSHGMIGPTFLAPARLREAWRTEPTNERPQRTRAKRQSGEGRIR